MTAMGRFCPARNFARLAPHVGKGHRAVLIEKSGFVRTGCGGDFQPVEHVGFHACQLLSDKCP